jgi:hypothetical protein
VRNGQKFLSLILFILLHLLPFRPLVLLGLLLPPLLLLALYPEAIEKVPCIAKSKSKGAPIPVASLGFALRPWFPVPLLVAVGLCPPPLKRGASTYAPPVALVPAALHRPLLARGKLACIAKSKGCLFLLPPPLPFF